MGWTSRSHKRTKTSNQTGRQKKHSLLIPLHTALDRRAESSRKSKLKRCYLTKKMEPAQTKRAAPTIFAPRKNGTLHLCVDHRKNSDDTKRDSYPIPCMDKCIDFPGKAAIFSPLDANSGYCKIEIEEADRDETAFTSHHGLYQFIRMPFELRNAPDTFQRTMGVILSTLLWKCAIIYLDDIVIFSKSPQEHIGHVKTMLTLLRNASVAMDSKKCKISTERSIS